MQNELRNKLHEILKQRKETNPNYSLRALARDIGLSPSLVSEFLNNKRAISQGSIYKLERFFCSLSQK